MTNFVKFKSTPKKIFKKQKQGASKDCKKVDEKKGARMFTFYRRDTGRRKKRKHRDIRKQ